MRAVLDANVVVAGVCWQGDGWLCLVNLARRRAFAYGSEATLEEARETALRIIEEQQPKHNAAGRLTWYLENVRQVTPAPLGKRRSRDFSDVAYLSVALAARATVIVTYDLDLLALGKPFGIEIIRPARFLQLLSA